MPIQTSLRYIDKYNHGLQVGDSELASKLARARLQQLTTHETSTNSKGTSGSGIRDGCHFPKPSTTYNAESQNDNLHSELQSTKNIDVPFKEEIMNCAALYANSLPTKVV